ncbi:SgcJ/EcaC family oxidoreductase [Pseudomonas sp.]|uniref:SgcJ/EcaC family oxidoreductase n=1 Tax=Pseudomonas sp. TaxID=306 RepID=UPI003D6FE553
MKHPTLLLPLAVLAIVSFPVQASNCVLVSEAQVLELFSQWNNSLQSGEPQQVAALYSDDAILLPTLSSEPRLSATSRIDYFKGFLSKQPSGALDTHHVTLGCNMANLSGLYTFTLAQTGEQVPARYSFTYRLEGGRWLINSHHSSLLPAS